MFMFMCMYKQNWTEKGGIFRGKVTTCRPGNPPTLLTTYRMGKYVLLPYKEWKEISRLCNREIRTFLPKQPCRLTSNLALCFCFCHHLSAVWTSQKAWCSFVTKQKLWIEKQSFWQQYLQICHLNHCGTVVETPLHDPNLILQLMHPDPQGVDIATPCYSPSRGCATPMEIHSCAAARGLQNKSTNLLPIVVTGRKDYECRVKECLRQIWLTLSVR